MNKKQISTREWYDFIGQLAGTLPGFHLGGQDATRKLLDMCQPSAESLVLDVGCGSGNTACFIVTEYAVRVFGIDLSKVMIAKAAERARGEGVAESVAFCVADIYQMPFDGDSFDVVLLESVLTPLSGDKKEALSEMVRVLLSGGLIAANESTVDPSAPEEYLALFREHPAIYGYFSSQTLRSLFEESGLQVVKMDETKYVKPPGGLEEMGLGGLLSFMLRVYPKILLKLLRDARFRNASKVDDEITKRGKQYMGYTLIVGRKAG